MKDFHVALCQTLVSADKRINIDLAETRIVEAARKGAKLVVLPEMFNCPYDTACFPEYAETIPHGPTCKRLSTLAKKLHIFLVGGSVPEQEGKKLYNTSPVFNPTGRLIARHRKIHLFDVSLKGVVIRESDVLSPGNSPTVFNTPFGPMGLIICYDLRFPELFRLMLLKKIKAVVIPGAFSVVTGSAHWHALLRMRAVDNQVYLLAASPARDNRASYKAFGHSLVVDPWGDILAEAALSKATVHAELSDERLKDIRARLPLLIHRRKDLY